MKRPSKAAAKASPARKGNAPAAKRGEGAVPTPKRMGRPPGGKHSNPQYMQTTLWVPRDLMTEVKIKLLRSEYREFSGTVEMLLRTWLKSRAPQH
jgi:hypothetical protein